MLGVIWDQFLGQTTWSQLLGEWRDAFFVEVTDTETQGTVNETNQQACPKNILALARNNHTELGLHCCSFSAPSHGFPNKKEQRWIRNR